MMPTTRRTWITMGALLAGLFGGAVGAQVVETARRARSLDTAMFAMRTDDKVNFYVTLNNTVSGPAHVRLQFLDQTGSTTLSQDVVLQPGQSTRLSTTGAGFLRGHAELMDDALQFTSQPALLGAVEVLNLTTLQRGPVCTIWDNGVDGQRQ